MTAVLSPTARTTITRHRERGSDDRADLFAMLDEALVCHVGIVRDGEPVVLPAIHAVDPDGPGRGRHALPARLGRRTVAAAGARRDRVRDVHPRRRPRARAGGVQPLDELPLGRGDGAGPPGRRPGRARPRAAPDRRPRRPGRSATLRANTRKELAATAVIAVPLAEASVKARDRGPADDADGRRDRHLGRRRPADGRGRRDRARPRRPRARRRTTSGRRVGGVVGRSIGCRPWSAPWSWSSPTAYAVASPVR